MTVGIPVCLEEWGGTWVTVLCVMMAVLHAAPVFAQSRGGYSLSGDVNSSVRFSRNKPNRGNQTDSLGAIQGVSLTGAGPIYDARLASFSLSGTLSFDDTQSDPGEDQESRFWSLFSSLSLLSGTRYPLGLRFSRSAGKADETRNTGTSYGITWNPNFRRFPQISTSYDHSETESLLTDEKRSLTIDAARLRLSRQMATSRYELELTRTQTEDSLGVEDFTTNGRFSYNNRLSREWDLTANASVDQEEGKSTTGENRDRQNIALSSSANYTPNADVRANGSAFYSRTEAENAVNQSAGASVNATRRFQISPQLEGGTSLSGFASHIDSGGSGGNLFWSGGASGNLVSTQYKPVRAAARYGLNVSKGSGSSVANVGGESAGIRDEEDLQISHQFNLNLASRTLSPYTLSGDYSYVLVQGGRDLQTHRASLLATGALPIGVSFRARAEGSLTDDPKVLVTSADASLTYSPRFDLSLTSGASASRVETEDEVTTILRIPVTIRYAPWRNSIITLDAFREEITNETGRNDRVNHEVNIRLEQQLRRVRLTLEISAQDTRAGDSRNQNYQVMLRVSRPFAFSF